MKRIGSFIAGLLVGTMLFGGSVAYAAGVVAELSSHRFFVDGQEVKMTAYAINGNNYVMLRDIGKAVGFNVHWDSTNGCVQIESDKPYTGTAPAKTQSVAVGAKKADYTQADVMPEPKAGDKIPCSDGYVYEITDVSKYQNSMFAMQETDTLPDPTCDWSLLDQPTLPEPEANHFTSGGKEDGTRPEKNDENFGNQPDGPPLRILRKAPRHPNETGRRDRPEGHFFHLSRRFFGKKRIFGFRTDNEQR